MHSVNKCTVILRLARGCEPRAKKSKHNKLKNAM